MVAVIQFRVLFGKPQRTVAPERLRAAKPAIVVIGSCQCFWKHCLPVAARCHRHVIANYFHPPSRRTILCTGSLMFSPFSRLHWHPRWSRPGSGCHGARPHDRDFAVGNHHHHHACQCSLECHTSCHSGGLRTEATQASVGCGATVPVVPTVRHARMLMR